MFMHPFPQVILGPVKLTVTLTVPISFVVNLTYKYFTFIYPGCGGLKTVTSKKSGTIMR